MNRILIILFGVFYMGAVYALPPHEAFIPKITPSPILQAVANPPPQEYDQKIPPQPDPQLIWIQAIGSGIQLVKITPGFAVFGGTSPRSRLDPKLLDKCRRGRVGAYRRVLE